MTDKVRLSSFDSIEAKGVVVYCVHRVPDELYSETGRDRVDSIPRWTPYATPPLAPLESVPIPSLNVVYRLQAHLGPLPGLWPWPASGPLATATSQAFGQPGSRALADLNLNLGLLVTWHLGGHSKP